MSNPSHQDTSPTEDLSKTVSVVIPLYNESEVVDLLFEMLHKALTGFGHPWELIVVDDGSTDGTPQKAHRCAEQYGSHIRVIELQRNFGQTAAMQAGIDQASGEIIVTLDGDLQNDPADIPRMVSELESRKLDLLVGWRKKRKDALIMRKIPSRIANWLIGKVTGVTLHDYGCSLKAYRGNVIRKIRLYGEMHRFIPAWVASVTSPSRIGEIEVNHHARELGHSKYGISRTFRVIIDLLSMLFFVKYRARPGHFFGSLGLVSGALGGFILAHLAVTKFVFGEDIGNRPLLLVGIVLIVAAAQFLTTGVLAELLVRTYYESSERCSYEIAHPEQLAATQFKAPSVDTHDSI